ncbi:unnamed protein product, partial [marine sediment metagenome]
GEANFFDDFGGTETQEGSFVKAPPVDDEETALLKRNINNLELARTANSTPGMRGGLSGPPGMAMQMTPIRAQVQAKQQARQDLINQGADPQTVDIFLDSQKKRLSVGQQAGGVAGAIAGAKLATTVGALLPFPEEILTVPVASILGYIGGISGTYGGAFAGEAAQQVLSGEGFDSIDAHKAGKEEAIWEVGSRAIFGAAKKLDFFGLAGKKPLPKNIQDAQDLLGTQNGFLAPDQMGVNATGEALVGISRSSFGGSKAFKALDERQADQAIQIANDMIQRTVGQVIDDPSTFKASLGEELADIFVGVPGKAAGSGRKQLLDEVFIPVYQQIAKDAGGIKPDTRRLITYLEDGLRRNEKSLGSNLSPEGVASVKRKIGLMRKR